MIEWIKSNVSFELLLKLGGVLCAIALFALVYRVVRGFFKKKVSAKLKPQTTMLIEKAIKYTFSVCVTLYVLGLFGIDLSALLGAAGIAGVAIGFAAQTSFSNIISGFFILSEHTFQVGDFITVGGTSGTVHSINLLSILVKTPDSQIVRIPNQALIETDVMNTTFFPQRRFLLSVAVPYESDLDEIERLLLAIAHETEHVLDDPAPVVIFSSFGSGGIEIQLGVWFNKENFLAVKNGIFKNVHKKLAEAGVEIPFEHITVQLDAAAPSVQKATATDTMPRA